MTATIANLTAGATYDYALVASSSLGTVVGATSIFQPAASSCVAEHGVITEDSQALTQAKYALTLDELGQGAQVASAEATLVADEATAATDEQAVAADESNATNANTTFTELPRLGAVIDRGQSVYRLNEQPVPLFYGPVPLYRALYLGVSPGPDVAELNRNLIALDFEHGAASDVFTARPRQRLRRGRNRSARPRTASSPLATSSSSPVPSRSRRCRPRSGRRRTGGCQCSPRRRRRPSSRSTSTQRSRAK